jgi:putative copper export protein
MYLHATYKLLLLVVVAVVVVVVVAAVTVVVREVSNYKYSDDEKV